MAMRSLILPCLSAASLAAIAIAAPIPFSTENSASEEQEEDNENYSIRPKSDACLLNQ